MFKNFVFNSLIIIIVSTIIGHAQSIDLKNTNSKYSINVCDSIYKVGTKMPMYKNEPIDLFHFIHNEIAPILTNSNIDKASLISRLFTELVISKNGEVLEVRILTQLNNDLETKLEKAFFQMQGWKPGKINEQKVCMKVMIPLRCIKWDY